MGSANAVETTADDGDGFWMAVEEVTHAQVISAEPDTLFDEPEEVAHAHAVSAELDALLGESEILEDVLCAQTEGAEFRVAPTVVRPSCTKTERTRYLKRRWLVPFSRRPSRSRSREPYYSGAIRHISPYHSDLPLSPPVFLNAANQQHFPAVGTGTLAIRVPNKGTRSELALCCATPCTRRPLPMPSHQETFWLLNRLSEP